MAFSRRRRTNGSCLPFSFVLENIAKILLVLIGSSLMLLPSASLSVQARQGAAPAAAAVRSGSVSSKPIVYTIAGSDSGGGAGIQADLHAIQNFGCHGCSAITCLTAQNSVGVTAVHIPDAIFLEEQLHVLLSDLPPSAIKIGMLATQDLAQTVGSFLKELRSKQQKNPGEKIWVVLDPVMISTSGSRLLDEKAQQTLIDEVFPYVDIITPNKFEAEALLNGRTLTTAADVEQAAFDLLQLGSSGVSAVLIKGGHTDEDGKCARDYLLVKQKPRNESELRLCDGNLGVWLQSKRYDTIHTHGTGCTLSSSMAAALALGESSRHKKDRGGAFKAMDLVDACCLAKAYVSKGICDGIQLGKGPGPVAQTTFPASSEHYPIIVPPVVNASPAPFLSMTVSSGEEFENVIDGDRPALGRILPIVDSVEWVQRLCDVSLSSKPFDGVIIQDIQLRIKGEKDPDRILKTIQNAKALCDAAKIRLWINDYWEAAVDAGCFGVHVGQEDLYRCVQDGGLDVLRRNNLALGISTHSFGELAAALGIQPSYISLGPIFATGSKKVQFDPQGLDLVSKWRELIPQSIPLVTIGGIGDAETAAQARKAGCECVAVIGAVTASKKATDIVDAVFELNKAMA